MNKESSYNMSISYNDEVILYNTLSQALCRLTKEEFSVITDLLKDLEVFEQAYPRLFSQMKEDGYIINQNVDELAFIRYNNRLQIYGDRRLHITINPTLDCNLTCWYCSTEYAKAFHSGRMSDEMVEALKTHIYNQITVGRIPALHLDWFGGEPLMYFDQVIYPIASYAKQLCEEHNVIF